MKKILHVAEREFMATVAHQGLHLRHAHHAGA